MLVDLKKARLAFPQLFEAKTVNGEGEPAFSASFILEPKNPSVKEVEAAIVAVAKEKWGEKATAVLKELKAKDKTCLHDGDLKSQYDGFPGNLYVTSRSKKRPPIYDKNPNNPTLTAADGKPYAGCFVNAKVDIWAMDNNFGKRICATLAAVQHHSDGEAFSGAAPVTADQFDVIDEEDSDLV